MYLELNGKVKVTDGLAKGLLSLDNNEGTCSENALAERLAHSLRHLPENCSFIDKIMSETPDNLVEQAKEKIENEDANSPSNIIAFRKSDY